MPISRHCTRCRQFHPDGPCPIDPGSTKARIKKKQPNTWGDRSKRKDHDRMTSRLREKVQRAAEYSCQNCGEHVGVKGQVDHILPISKGGKTELRNLWYLCLPCHGLKTAVDMEKRKKMRGKTFR